MIVAFRHMKLPFEEISNLIQKSKTSIGDFYRRYSATGDYNRQEGSGGKRKISDTDIEHMELAIKRDRHISRKELSELIGAQDVTLATISTALKRSGLVRNGFQSRKPFVNEKNRKKRLKWCRIHKNWTLEQWKQVIWSDESPFVFRYQRRSRVWKLSTEKFHISRFKGTVKHEKKIMVWGCFAWHGVGSLYKVQGILEQRQYHKILKQQLAISAKKLFPRKKYIFQQDNDPKHTSKLCKNYLRNKKIKTLDWPAQSPDLNPIENLWSILDMMVKDRKPQTDDQLMEVLTNGWNSIEITKLNNLVESMQRRCEAVIANNGYPCNY